MTEKQKNFLTELHELLRKHNIHRVYLYCDAIKFQSGRETLAISGYDAGKFVEIETYTEHFKP